MTTTFHPTEDVPDGKFPSAFFSALSNRAVAALVAAVIVYGVQGNGSLGASFYLFVAPCAVANSVASWAQYASLTMVTFSEQTLFKSSKIIIVMIMCQLLNGVSYRPTQYAEGALLTVGVLVLSYLTSNATYYDYAGNKGTIGELMEGVTYLLIYVISVSFTVTWQDWIYRRYGRANVNVFQMMLGINVTAIALSLIPEIFTGDLIKSFGFIFSQPDWRLVKYLLIVAKSSTIGQVHMFCLIREFGPVVYIIFMAARSIPKWLSGSGNLGHLASATICAVVLIIGVLLYQIRREYIACRTRRKATSKEDPPLFLIIPLLVFFVVGLVGSLIFK